MIIRGFASCFLSKKTLQPLISHSTVRVAFRPYQGLFCGSLHIETDTRHDTFA